MISVHDNNATCTDAQPSRLERVAIVVQRVEALGRGATMSIAHNFTGKMRLKSGTLAGSDGCKG